MAELRWTAYDAVAEAVGNANMNNLANNFTAIGGECNFEASGTDRKIYIDLDLELGSVDLSSQTSPTVFVWLLRTLDGTNYEDGGAGNAGNNNTIVPPRAPDAIIGVQNTNAAHRGTFRMVVAPPKKGKFLVLNRTGAALSASNNSVLEYYTYSVESV